MKNMKPTRAGEKGEREMKKMQAEVTMRETHKGNKHTASYGDVMEAAKTKMRETLRLNGEQTDSTLYASTDGNFNVMINIAIEALRQMVECGKVTKRHEMVDGYKSTYFYMMA